MTVTALPSRNEFIAAAGQTIFAYTFKIYSTADLNVYVTPAGQDANDSTDITTSFTVLGVNDPSGGSITLTTPTSVNDLVTIVSNIAEDRTVNYQQNSDFIPDVVNSDFDRVVSLSKQQADRSGRTLAFQESLQNATELSLPDPSAGLYLRWKGDLTGVENAGAPSVSVPAVEFSTVADMAGSTTLAVGTMVFTAGYFTAGDRGLATYLVEASQSVDEIGDHTLANGNVAILQTTNTINVNQFGMFADTPIDGTIVTDHTTTWLHIVDTLRPGRVYLPGIDGFSYRMQLFKVKADMEVFGDGSSLTQGTVVEVFNIAMSVVMGQINSDSRVSALRIKSLEPDLELQRTTVGASSNVTLEKMVFEGFRDVTGPADAWGLYMKDSTNISVKQCGFDDNTQADIAIVENNKNCTIDGCYGTGSVFHVSFEPNSSTTFNENITVKNMEMTKLSILENGSGGTANKAITISACEIDTLVYDGGQVTLQDCQLTDFEIQTSPFFGELRLINTMALGPNLLEDPYLVNNAFNEAQAGTDGNAWFINSRTGSIGTDELDPLEEDGVRFIRLNPTNVSGTINFRNTTPIATTSGEYYVIAVTGRNQGGTSAAYMQIFDGVTNFQARIFRQSNEGINYWTTELLIVPADTGDFLVRVGTWITSTESVDIRAVTMHKFLGKGGGEQSILNQFHGNLYGPRELLPVATLPVFSSADVRGILPGDRISLTGNGAPFRWDGTAFQAM